MLRISLRLVHGQTGPRRVSAHTPAEVVAQGGDTERVVDARRQPGRPVHLRWSSWSSMTRGVRLVRAGAVLRRHDAGLRAGRDAVRAAAGALGPRSTVAARAAFATALVSSLSAARTVKLAGATAAGAGPPGPPRRRPQRPAAPGDLGAGVGPVDAVAGQRPAADRRLGAVPGRRPVRRARRWSRCPRSARPAGSPGPPRRWSRSCPRRGCGPGARWRWPASARTRRRCRASTSPPAPRPAPRDRAAQPAAPAGAGRVQRGARGRHGRRAATST